MDNESLCSKNKSADFSLRCNIEIREVFQNTVCFVPISFRAYNTISRDPLSLSLSRQPTFCFPTYSNSGGQRQTSNQQFFFPLLPTIAASEYAFHEGYVGRATTRILSEFAIHAASSHISNV